MFAAGYMVAHPPIAVPEIGRGEERKIKNTLDSFDKVASDIGEVKPDVIIISSPHAAMYRNFFHISPGGGAAGDFGQFNAGNVRIGAEYDEELARGILAEAKRRGFPAGMDAGAGEELDHGTMVPLYFIRKRYQNFKLVRIGLSGLSLKKHWEFGKIIRGAVDASKKKCVFVASGDLSHCQKADGPYGFRPAGPEYDSRIMDVMGDGEFEKLVEFDEGFLDESMECGHRSFTIMGGAFEGMEAECRRLSHEAVFGVGYGFCIYRLKGAK